MSKESLQKAYAGLVSRCNKLAKYKFLLSGQYIAEVLRYIASTPELIGYVSACNMGVDYRACLAEATAGDFFRLPKDAKTAVALVTGLLYDFDRKVIGLHQFLRTYFKDDDVDKSYAMFCNKVITPYLLAFKGVLDGGEVDDAPTATDNPAEESVRETIIPYIAALTETVMSDEALDDEVKEKYVTMLEGLYLALESSGVKLIKVVWMGMKAVMGDYRGGASYLKSIEKIMKSYAML